MRYFVTGGSGFVGRHLLLRLLAEGNSVRALARSEEAARVVTALGATPVRADLLDLRDHVDELAGVSVVVHAAADTRPWGPAEDFDRVNVEGTRAVLDAARAAKVSRFVHLSTEAVLADGHPLRFVDETAPYPRKHVGDYARTKALAEQLVLASANREFRAIALRPRLVWGPGDTTVLPHVLSAARQGHWAWVGGGDYLTSTCHVANLCEGIVAAATRGKGREVYFLTDGPPVRFRDFMTRLAATYGVTMPDRSVPHVVARAAAGTVDRGWRLLHLRGEPPLSLSALALGGQEMTVNDAKARQRLGYTPVLTVEEGLVELAELAALEQRDEGDSGEAW